MGGVVNIHPIGQSLVHGVQDISVNVIELQGFVLPQVRLVIVEELRLDFGSRFPVGLFFSIGFLHTLRQILFESFGSCLSTGISSRVQPLLEDFVLFQVGIKLIKRK